jgi:hypothetical protein
MAVRISLNFDRNDCKLVVQVWDILDRGLDGNLIINFSSSHSNFQKEVKDLRSTPQIFEFDTDKTGNVHQIVGVLDVNIDADTDKMWIELCS